MSALTECTACEGTGNLIVQERPRGWYDDGLEFSPCWTCDGTGFLCDHDALAFGQSDTIPAPPPEGCAA